MLRMLVPVLWIALQVSGVEPESPNAGLLEASANGDTPRVQALLAAGADVEATGNIGRRPLHLAVAFGQVETAAALLDAGANVRATYADGVTPLMLAVGQGRNDLVRKLLDAGADVNAPLQGGMTPLMYAAQNGHLDTVALLLDAGASAGSTARGLGSARDLAERSGQGDIVDLLAMSPTERSRRERPGASSVRPSLQEVPAEGEPVRVGGKIQPPRKVKDAYPEYPNEMKLLGVQGLVVLKSLIDRTGRVTRLEVMRSVHPLLDRAAIECARKYRFEPTLLNGEPVPVVYVITLRFGLVPTSHD